MSFSVSRGKAMIVTGVGVEQSELPPFDQGAIDPRKWFGAEGSPEYLRPLDLEIGSGKGTFLVQEADRRDADGRPERNFLGIEYARAFWKYAADRCRRHGLTNVKLLHTEAGFFVRNYLPDASLDRVHIYFPDPWPKARHHKRRLVQEPFLRQLQRVLRPGGEVRLATDHTEYFAWMEVEAAKVADRFERLAFDRPASAGQGELVGTNFERKYRREGRPFFAMILRTGRG